MRLFLLDGMALIFRAHFAFIHNPIRNSKGINTSALYGFANTLVTLLEKERPTHIGVAFDTSAPTARHTLYPDYKGHRDATPEELIAAIPHVKRLCCALNIPVIERDGFEADDLIGTLAHRASLQGFHTCMVTADKDFAQLVDANTVIWRPGRKGSEHDIIDLAAVREQWLVQDPKQVIDILGLWGDAVDNIPGVPGIGEKTAKKLISEWHSIDHLLANLSQIKGKLRENLELHADQARLSRQLATIWLDSPIECSWDDLALSPPNAADLRDLLLEFEFRSLLKRFFPSDSTGNHASATTELALAETDADGDAATQSPSAPLRSIRDTAHDYRIVTGEDDLASLCHTLLQQPRFCFDTETTGLDPRSAQLLGIAFSWQAHQGCYLPWPVDPISHARLSAVFAANQEKIAHNLKFDLAILNQNGIHVAGPYFDTMLAHSLLHPDQRHGMDRLAEQLLRYRPIAFSDIAETSSNASVSEDLFSFASNQGSKKKDLSIANIPLNVLAEYACEDADVTFQLASWMRAELDAAAQSAVFSEIEMPLLPVLERMETNGISLDLTALREIGAELEIEIQRHRAAIENLAGRPINVNSPKQLGELLFDTLQLDPKAKKTATGQYKTDEATLQQLAGRHPIIDTILEYREASKLKSTYIDALPEHIHPRTQRLHTTFHPLVAATGRLASTDPNLQNIPIRSGTGQKIRSAFIARPETNGAFQLLSCDYSQIELRIMAALSGDPSMIEAFHRDEDIHRATAARVFHVAPAEVDSAMRRSAKMVNFGIIYGISAFGLAQRLQISRSEAASIIERYFQQYPAVKAYMESSIATARAAGYTTTLSGRRRLLPDLASANANVRSNAERAAINTPIQGSAADMIKLAMIRIDARLQGFQTRMLLQVHDELVFDLHRDEQAELVPKILADMRDALPLPHEVPILVEAGIGPNWLAAH